MNNPFAPVEGHYALLRNGVVMGAYKQNSQGFWVGVASDINIFWKPDGTAYGSDNHGNRRLKPDHDIIATISPEAMALAIHPDMDGAVKAIESLVKLADAACDYADQNCRWFDISTAPWLQDKDGEYDYRSPDSGEGIGHVYKTDLYDEEEGVFLPDVHVGDVFYKRIDHVIVRPLYWRPLPPPPSNPPLPDVFTELGQALERLKEGQIDGSS